MEVYDIEKIQSFKRLGLTLECVTAYGRRKIVFANTILVNPLYTGKSLMGTLANSEDQDEMQQLIAAFHQGLHCLLKLQQNSVTEIHVHHNLERSTCDPLMFTFSKQSFNESLDFFQLFIAS